MHLLYSCHILGNLILLHHIPKGAHILVSYSWHLRIIAPYSERCAYSCVIFLATSYYCTIFQKHVLIVFLSYSWQPHIITLYSKRCTYFCVIFLVTSYYCTVFQKVCIFLCHILGNLVLLHRIPRGVHILVSYSIQTHIIALCSDGCTHSYVILLV